MGKITNITEHKGYAKLPTASTEMIVAIASAMGEHIENLSDAEVIGALEMVKLFYYDAMYYEDDDE